MNNLNCGHIAKQFWGIFPYLSFFGILPNTKKNKSKEFNL